MDLNILIPSLISGIVTAFGAVLGFIATPKSVKQKEEENRQKQLADLENRLSDKLSRHKEEYLQEIGSVKTSIRSLEDTITEMKAEYQTTVATVSLQIDTLEKAQNKHNSVIERTYALERDVEVLKNRESVSEHRLKDIEEKAKA